MEILGEISTCSGHRGPHIKALVSKTRRGFSLNVRRGGTVLCPGIESSHQEVACFRHVRTYITYA